VRLKPILLILGVVFVLLLGWIYFPVLTKYRNLKIEEEAITKQIEELDGKIAKLREEKRLLEQDREYLEKVVRDELGLVKPGEVVYKFVKDYLPLKKPEIPLQIQARFGEAAADGNINVPPGEQIPATAA